MNGRPKKYTQTEIDEMKRLRDNGYTYREIAKSLGISRTTVSNAIHGKKSVEYELTNGYMRQKLDTAGKRNVSKNRKLVLEFVKRNSLVELQNQDV